MLTLEGGTREQYLGDIISALNARRAHIESIETLGEMSTVHTLVPLSETFGYATSLRSETQGRATHSMEFYRYQELPAGLTAQIIEKTGTTKYV
jgi:elongation factor G